MPAMKPSEVARQHRGRTAAANGGTTAPAATATLPRATAAEIAALRDRLRAAIAAVGEEEDRHSGLTQAQDRARAERRQAQDALDDARGKLEGLRRDARVELAYAYLNREATKLPLAETEALIDRHRAEVAHLDEVDAALTAELAASAERLRALNQDRQQVLVAVIIADPSFQALVDAIDDAWNWLRTIR